MEKFSFKKRARKGIKGQVKPCLTHMCRNLQRVLKKYPDRTMTK